MRKRERIVSADMSFERIASTSGVRTHRKNEQFSLVPDLPILLLGKPHTPFMSKLKILPELFGKVLAFIRFDDYNYTVILQARAGMNCDRSADYEILIHHANR